MGTEAETWLKDKYPELYKEWREAYLKPCWKKVPLVPDCTICLIRPHTGSHYSVYTCEADKQFLKRTFHERQQYQICCLRCPPRLRGWCQYCRLQCSLSTGINLKMIRMVEKSKKPVPRTKRAKKNAPSFYKNGDALRQIEPATKYSPFIPPRLTGFNPMSPPPSPVHAFKPYFREISPLLVSPNSKLEPEYSPFKGMMACHPAHFFCNYNWNQYMHMQGSWSYEEVPPAPYPRLPTPAWGEESASQDLPLDLSFSSSSSRSSSRPPSAEGYTSSWPPSAEGYRSSRPPSAEGYRSSRPPSAEGYTSFQPSSSGGYMLFRPPSAEGYTSFQPPSVEGYTSFQPPSAESFMSS